MALDPLPLRGVPVERTTVHQSTRRYYQNAMHPPNQKELAAVLQELEQRYDGVSNPSWGTEVEAHHGGFHLNHAALMDGTMVIATRRMYEEETPATLVFQALKPCVVRHLWIPGWGPLALDWKNQGKALDVFDTITIDQSMGVRATIGSIIMYQRMMEQRCGECGAPLSDNPSYLW